VYLVSTLTPPHPVVVVDCCVEPIRPDGPEGGAGERGRGIVVGLTGVGANERVSRSSSSAWL
jgi:hypothetical protein